MSPEVVAMDEISAEEVHLVERYACCGVHLCASVHGTDWAQMVGRMGLYPASPTGFAFDWYARLDRGAVVELLNREGQP